MELMAEYLKECAGEVESDGGYSKSAMDRIKATL
jgi:hypothetical protein